MILADNVEDRKQALAKLLPYQKADFVGIFKALKGFPATIRFLDPPLHEFLPHEDAAQQDLATKMGVPVAKIKQRVKELHEFNPMLGSAAAVWELFTAKSVKCRPARYSKPPPKFRRPASR